MAEFPLQLHFLNESYAYVYLVLEEQADLLNIVLYVLLAVTIMILIWSFLRNKRKADFSTQLWALEALHSQVLDELKLTYDLLLEVLEQKLDDRLRSMFYTMQADLSIK